MVSRLAVAMALITVAACNSRHVIVAETEAGPESMDVAPTSPAAPREDEPRSAASATPKDTRDRAAMTPEPRVTLTTERLEVLGQSRSYVLAAPANYLPKNRYPLVLVLHGDGGDGPSMRAAFPFDAVSAESAFVAYPTGTEGWDLYSPLANNVDQAFIVAIVESLGTRFSVDLARVFGTGFSSGAFMVSQLACRLPTLFRAIAPQAGGAPDEPIDATATKWENNYTRCAKQTHETGPAVMVVHGTSDPVVTLESGDFSARYWAYINNCATSRSPAARPATCMRHDACPADRPVIFCPVEDLDHSLWREAAQSVWLFFRQL